MNNELKALQNLEQSLNSKKEVFQSCIQEWEGVIRALEAVEKARLDDLKEKVEKAKNDIAQTERSKELEKFKKEMLQSAVHEAKMKDLQDKQDRQKYEEEMKKISKFAKLVKSEKSLDTLFKDGDPITAQNIKDLYSKMSGK